MGLQVQVLNAGTSREINAAFDTFVRERPDLLFVGLDAYLNRQAPEADSLSAGRLRLGTIPFRGPRPRGRGMDHPVRTHCSSAALYAPQRPSPPFASLPLTP